MQTFSSSTKVLTSFAESPQIRELTRVFGDRLSGLTRLEKYQLVAAIGLTLWWLDPTDQEIWPEADIATLPDQVLPSMEDNTMKAIAILEGEHPDNLAAILAPIAEYAREDDRLR